MVFQQGGTRRGRGEKRGQSQRRRKAAKNIVLLAVFVLACFLTVRREDESSSGKNEQPPPVTGQLSSASHEKISVDIQAQNACLWNLSTDTVLYEKESEERIAPASTAKMLTALTVLDYCDAEDEVLVGKETQLIAGDASRAWLYPGNRLTVRQLLEALLVPSGNDAAYALAVFAGRKIDGDKQISTDEALKAFMRAMNEKAAGLGAVNSNFVNPDGYDAKGQFTTVNDLACIAREFIQSRILRDIAGRYFVADVWLSGQKAEYYNTNELINPNSRYYDPCVIGLKTGKSAAAGCCLVSSGYIAGQLYLCVVMGSTEEGRWMDTLALYRAIKDNRATSLGCCEVHCQC